MSCQALGPFLSEAELEAFRKRLGKRGLSATPQTRYLREQVGYTVVLPSRDYEDALQIKRKLEKNNITANFTDKDNVLTLGAFREKSLAEKELARAEAIGLDPRLEPGYARRSTYWLVFEEEGTGAQDLAALTRKSSDLRVEKLTCP